MLGGSMEAIMDQQLLASVGFVAAIIGFVVCIATPLVLVICARSEEPDAQGPP